MLVHRKYWGWFGLLLAALVLGACGNETQTVQVAPTQPPSPTVDELSTLIAMQQVATAVPTATPWPTHTPTRVPTDTPTPTATLSPTLTQELTHTPLPVYTAFPTNTPRAEDSLIEDTSPTAVAVVNASNSPEDHYWLARPFPRDPTNAIVDYLSRSYPYGSTSNGQLQTHHGVDIPNPLGTPILAVASGWVVYAGSDKVQQFGPRTDFYGNLVVIEHDVAAPNGQMLYTLYGHMSRVGVETGQHVNQLDQIGNVGATGVALGSHLHLEVRLGDPYDYSSTYNPDLWLRPWPTFGTLAGRIMDQDGNRVYDATISIRSEDGLDHYTYSYADDYVNSDPDYGENWVRGDLPEGDYKISVRIRSVLRFQGTAHVTAGQTNWLDIVLN